LARQGEEITEMNGSEVLARALRSHGIERVFSHAGGTISHPLHHITRAGIEIVVLPTEAGAGHAAQAAYRLTGQLQVVLVTSGPGVTNVLTPVADAYFDGDAILVVAGQVEQSQANTNHHVRQWGFQEVDALALAAPITKAAIRATRVESLGATVGYLADAALGRLVADRRPGPCLLEFPMDVQRQECLSPAVDGRQPWAPIRLSREKVHHALEAMMASRRPMILAGRGAVPYWYTLRRFIDRFMPGRWLVASSLPAVGVVPTTDPRCVGFIGHTGHPQANRELASADCLLVLGARLDVRQVGTASAGWSSGIRVIRVDCSLEELTYSRVPAWLSFTCDVGRWLQTALEVLDGH